MGNQVWNGPLEKIDDYRFRIPKTYKPGMLVDGIIYADEKMLSDIRRDQAPEQVANVAFLPGIVKYSLAMPDIHWGYGFCVTGDTKVLTQFGFYKPIKDFERDWSAQNLKCLDLQSQKVIETSVLRFIKLEPKEVFKIITKGGYEIKATGDHPLFTPSGMQTVRELSPGKKVAIFPFQGVAYEEPPNEVIISEKDIRKTLLNLGREPGTPKFEIVIQKLKKRNLLPLTYAHPKLPYILKIMGFVFGDGSMNFIGERGDGVIHFSGNPQDLENVRRDLREIGYTPSPIHFRKVKDSRGGNKYYNCYSFLVNASSLVILLETLGVPRGNKVAQAYRVPQWIFKAPLWQKRLFLASLFGCELRIPHRRLYRRGYFNAPVFPMGKREELLDNGKDFLNDISKLLEEFGVEVLYIVKRRRHINKKGEASWALELLISPKPQNLFNLWSKIGFEYNSKRAFMTNVSTHYLKLKLKILKEKEEVINVTIPKLLKEGLSYQKIAFQLAGNPLTKRFIIDVCWKLNKGRKISPRIPFSFPNFSDYLKKVTEGLGMSGMVWDEIEKIERIPYEDCVYDFTVSHSDHNFIANNFVVSNCIGGVAATDPEKGGVISPGGVGYDINCLSGNSLILNELGYFLPLKDYEKIFSQELLSCADFTMERITSTKILGFLKEKPLDKKVYRMRTKTGKEIIATEDHPFYTKDGMKELKRIKVNEAVALYPFEGVEYREPSEEIIVDERKIERLLLKLGKGSSGHATQQIIKNLKKLNLLPLTFNSPSFPYLLKILGYCLGDGVVYFTNKTGKGITWFWGREEDLEEIRKDIQKIGFVPSRIYKRKRKHRIKTPYKIYEFENVEYSFKVTSSSFATILFSLGMPLGNKVRQKYFLPHWLFFAPLWQKRLFLASFFGAEMSAPATYTNHEFNFYCPTISMNKKLFALKSGIKFLKQLSSLLKEFGVITNKISQRKEIFNKGNISYRLRLILSNKRENLIALYTKIGFEYNRKKRFLANLAIQYLKEKELFVEEKKEVALQAVALKEDGLNLQEIYDEIGQSKVNFRFIERTIYEGRKSSPRYFGKGCLSFDEFVKLRSEGLGDSGMVWDEVVSKEEIKYDDYVYDFTVEHPHHNFIANNFVVSNCGVRLVKTNLFIDEVKPKLKELVSALFHTIPAGVGSTGDIRISVEEERELLVKGARWAVAKGYGIKEDLECTEEGGCIEGADPHDVSERAYERGKRQSGTLGSGNHFLEVQAIDRIYDRSLAEKFGLEEGQITIMIHSGSRGLGYQVCDDYLEIMGKAVRKYNINLPDRQLACSPVDSPEGRAYISAMRCAANYAWANRQCLMHLTRLAFERVFNKSWEALGMFLIYDVAHNIAKFEKYIIEGKEKTLCVHRKGATRAFGPGHPDLPERYKETGQPVIIPGDMGRNSYLLVGTKKAEETFFSTCHGAGRVMSRSQAIKSCKGRNISQELEEKGILVMASSRETLAEEIPDAYKDVNDVVRVVQGAGISKIVCRMKPLGVIKG